MGTPASDGWEDDEPLEVAISAIDHYSYCPRQCALIHVEGIYEENLFTVRGNLAHERVDSGEEAATRGVRTSRSVPLWSERLGLRGKSDAVEFHGDTPYPIEYKVGKPQGDHAALQLCAQALCLEEMLGVAPRGAIFYHALRRREEILFDQVIRQRTEAVIVDIRQTLEAQRLPEAPNDARCPNCSLVHACLPSVIGEPARLRGLQGALYHIW
jgi:CRISPR-associated exonuclease Cas4